MHEENSVNVDTYFDRRPFGPLQLKVLILCSIVLILDGFDVVIIGFVAPALVVDWHVSHASLAVLMSAGLFGLAIGALTGGPLGDRFGRRKTIIGALFFFGLASLASAWAPDITVLSVLRLLTGVGLGASQPNAATLASEYAPKKHRSLMVTLVYAGFTLGGALAGILAHFIIAEHGWPSVLTVGGVTPILFAIAFCKTLPESAKFLVGKGVAQRQLQTIFNALEPGIADATTRFVTSERLHANKNPVALIVSRPRAGSTFALWAGVFMTLMTVYFLNSWLPILMSNEGLRSGDAALVSAMFQAGGTLGIIVIGWKMDRFNPHGVLIGVLGGAAALTLAIGNMNLGVLGLLILVFLLGYCINSTNAGWTALSAAYYPTDIRATGISWMTGVGRLGAIVGTYAGAVLLNLHWTPRELFVALSVPISLALIAACIKGQSSRQGSSKAKQEPMLPSDF